MGGINSVHAILRCGTLMRIRGSLEINAQIQEMHTLYSQPDGFSLYTLEQPPFFRHEVANSSLLHGPADVAQAPHTTCDVPIMTSPNGNGKQRYMHDGSEIHF